MNSHSVYREIDQFIEYTPKLSRVPIEIFYSTPSKYIAALRSENASLPLVIGDQLPIGMRSGIFSSRPLLKKAIKDASATFSAHAALFSQLMINQKTPKSTISKALAAYKNSSETMNLVTNHKAISGHSSPYVAYDYMHKLNGSLGQSAEVYQRHILQDSSLSFCSKLSKSCPYLILHNSQPS
jgi:hypothetical protein